MASVRGHCTLLLLQNMHENERSLTMWSSRKHFGFGRCVFVFIYTHLWCNLFNYPVASSLNKTFLPTWKPSQPLKCCVVQRVETFSFELNFYKLLWTFVNWFWNSFTVKLSECHSGIRTQDRLNHWNFSQKL